MSPILQQNNNNNYPCLSAAGPRPLPDKCPLPSLPPPTRLELGLADLPLIRGLRAWALCSRGRHRPGGTPGQVPAALPSCPRPSDVHLSAEWGLPLGLDVRQASIGALVATLQTAEGSGRTQTQSLFLRTNRGSCLYPTAEPVSPRNAPGPGGVLGGWLRTKTRGAQAVSSHIGSNRARERSGRKWRKSNNTVGREKARTRQQRQDEARANGTDEEWQEKPHKESSGCEQDVPQTCPRSCQNTSPQLCTASPAQRDSQDQHSQRQCPRRGVLNGEKLTEETGEQPREELQDQPSEELREKHREHSCKEQESEYLKGLSSTTTFALETYVQETTSELQAQIIHSREEQGTAWMCRELPEFTHRAVSITNHVLSERLEADDAIEEEESLMSSLCDPPRSPECDSSPAPIEGSTCKSKSDVGAVAQSTDFHIEHKNGIVDNYTSLPVISNEIHNTDACSARCEGFLKKQCSINKSELRKETEVENELVNGMADSGSTENVVGDCKIHVEDVRHSKERNNSETNCTNPTLSNPDNPTPPPTAAGLPSLEVIDQERSLGEKRRGPGEHRGTHRELDVLERDAHRGPRLALESEDPLEDPLDDQEFGVFVQAPAWSQEYTNHEWSYGSPGGTLSSLDQSDDSWAVFPQDGTDHRRDVEGQWWPHSSVEDRGPARGANLSLASVFTAAFPLLTVSASCDPAVPTLTQLLRDHQGIDKGGSSDQGLLDTFHDLNKMIGQRYKRGNGVSRELLQRTLGLDPPAPGSSSSHCCLSPGLFSANQHAQNATARRRLSYDSSRNMD